MIHPQPKSKEDWGRLFSFGLYKDLTYVGVGFTLSEEKYFVFRFQYPGHLLIVKDEWYSEAFQKALVVTHE